MKRTHCSPASRRGFSLVEVTLAMGISAFCLTSIFGLLPVGLNSNQTSMEQTCAASVARAIACDLRGVAPGQGTSSVFKIGIPTTGSVTQTIYLSEDGVPTASQSTAEPSENPRYRATVVVTAASAQATYFGSTSGMANQGTETSVRILVTWPALADRVAANKPSNYSGCYEVVTALDRN